MRPTWRRLRERRFTVFFSDDEVSAGGKRTVPKEPPAVPGCTVESGPPKVLADLMKTEIPRWTKPIRGRNIKAE